MRWQLGVPLVIAGLLLACTPAGEAPVRPDPAVEALIDYLDQAVDTERFRGAVEVRRGGEVLLRRGFDYADPVAGVKNGLDTRFRIASVTKQFTALAVLVLQERGKLRVTDNVCVHLPACPPHWAPVTIEHLLTHTSGLLNYTDVMEENLDEFFRVAGGRQPTPEGILRTVADRPLEFPPGSRWVYSNSGYVLLGQLIERVSGTSYADFLRDEILDPLDMADTSYEPGIASGEEYAVGYEDWETPAMKFNTEIFAAAGGLSSTVTDLVRWQRFLLTGSPAVVRQETLAELLRPRVAENALQWYGYGIGSRGRTMAEPDSYFHSGGIPGFSSYIEIRPAEGVSVVVLANVAVNAEQFGRALAELV
jgi:CubicO group peptidase (beta-lactamase class C family)